MSDNSSDYSNQLSLPYRYSDILTRKAGAVVALGCLITWLWLGMVEGYPVFTDGKVCTAVVTALLLSFSASILAFGLLRRIEALLCSLPALLSATLLACGGSYAFVLLAHNSQLSYGVPHLLLLIAAVSVGAGSGVLALRCSLAFVGFRTASAPLAFFLSIPVMFVEYFVISTCGELAGGALKEVIFGAIPILIAICLTIAQERPAEQKRAVGEGLGITRGYGRLCFSFAAFFFALAAKAALEPFWEFATASDTSVAVALLLSIGIIAALSIRRDRKAEAFTKTLCEVSAILLILCVALQRLSLDPWMTIVFNMDALMMIGSLWLLASLAAKANPGQSGKVAGLALGLAAIGMALGWYVGSTAQLHFGHDRVYFSIALAGVVTTFSAILFSASSSFSPFSSSSEAAFLKKEIDYNGLLAERSGLSSREIDVFNLLLSGHNAASAASKLEISYHTARTHIRNIYSKLDVHSRDELMVACEEFRKKCDAELED